MFVPRHLHPLLLQADAICLPFPHAWFDLVTASNVLFLLPEPEKALIEMARVTQPGGWVAMLNPSERLSVTAAESLAKARGLQGLELTSLIHWAERAESLHRWSAQETEAMMRSVGLEQIEMELRVGPGFARFARGRV
jgi:ubiquinone/menaquinone biosynthesis C-methylase UbiE